ncbi:uncharacterized protein LOC128557842 [Mercenaria mercenaria]|uniref:uncharacterized protein LOC128557842 n=1 Tax=Mercenaria mercenaria TaxID=6596 RepID=UPI00234E42B8|nr:uncharacterized protein LOC128557842 [Mercenaria mercenaria]XP_053402310.1 uncharacterized protein LOC128557842 [Mercenaria mercenaria]
MDELYHLMTQKQLFINYSQPEIKDITTAVNILLTRLIGCFNSRNDRFFITKFVPGGSMVEQTRIWENQQDPMIEFDFLVLLQYRYEAQHIGYGCPGHLKVLNFETVRDTDGRHLMREEELRPNDVVQEHNMTILNILEEKCKGCRTCDVACVNHNASIPCTMFQVETESGRLELIGLEDESKGFLKPIVMQWHSHVKTLIRPKISKEIDIVQTIPNVIKIMADFVPGFQFSRLRIQELFHCNFPNFPKDIEEPDHFYVVPKLCPKTHPTCWRISYCTSEVQSMISTPQKHRDAYKMIKVFKHYALENTILSTYFMKSVVLRHIDKCEDGGLEMQPCLVEMLEYTLKCFQERELPHFVLGHDLFENRVFFQNTKQEEVFLKNLEKLIRKLRKDRFKKMLTVDGKNENKSLQIKHVLQIIAKLLTNHRQF